MFTRGARCGLALAGLVTVAALLPLTPAAATPVDSPADLTPSGATVGSNPQLTWTAVAGASRYRVQIDDTPGFTSMIVNEVTYNTTHTPRVALPTGTIYWRVAGIDSSGEGPFAQASFDKALAGPTLSTPTDGHAFAFPSQPPRFAWTPTDASRSYVLEIDDAPDFIGRTVIVTRATAYTHGETQAADQTFYWRVRGASSTSGTGVLTDWSETRTYSIAWAGAPVLVSPPDDTVAAIDDVELVWNPVVGADHYEVQVNTAADFTGLMVLSTNSETRRYSKPANLNNGSYHWRVRAVDVDGHLGTWSESRSFTRGWSSSPSLVAPADGATGVNPMRFEWSPVDHASHYELQVGTDPNFSPATFTNCYTNQTTFQPYTGGDNPPGNCSIELPTPGQLQYWRVRAIDAPTGILGLWSTIDSFVYDVPVPTPVSPADGATIDLPQFDWEPVDGAERYRIRVFNQGGIQVATTTTYATSYAATAALDPGASPFTWTVAVIDHEGDEGPTVDILDRPSFTLIAPSPSAATPEAITPTPGAASHEMPAMTWSGVTGASNYRIDYRVAGSSTSSQLVTNLKYAAYTRPEVPLAPGDYEFRVSALFNGAVIASGAWSSFEVANLDLVTLTGPTHCVPGGGCSPLAQTPTFDWDPVTGAGYYMVYVALDANFTNIYRSYTVAQTEFTPREEFADNDAGQAYFWHVRPCKTFNSCGPDPASTAAPSRAFLKRSNSVLLVSPAAGATVANQPVFTWEDYLESNQEPLSGGRLESQLGAREYRIQVSTSAGFATTLDNVLVDQTRFSPTGKTYPEGPLYWRVRALDGSRNELTWSATRVLQKVSAAPTLTAPSNDATLYGAPTFTWAPQAFASQYVLEVYRNGDLLFSPDNRVVNKTTDHAGWTLADPLAPGEYAWRVRREDSNGLDGPWSSGRVFTVSPRSVTLLTLANNAVVTNDLTVFSWNAVPGAATYRHQQAPTNTFLNNVYIDTVMTSWAPIAKLNDGTYFWRVLAYDQAGNVIGTSATRRFVRDSTSPTVVAKEPTADAGLRGPFSVTFSEPVTGVNANSFRLREAGTGTLVPAKVTVTSPTAARLVPDNPLVPGQTYEPELSAAIKDQSGNPVISPDWSVRTSTVVENTSPGLAERWSREAQTGASGGHVAASRTPGARTSLRFFGSGVVVLGSRGPDGGLASVWIDGVKRANPVTFFAASIRTRQTIISVSGLSTGWHTIDVVVTGTKPAASNAPWVRIDALRSGGQVFEETHARFQNRFATTASTSASGGSYDKVDKTGSGSTPTYRLVFVGTSVEWRGLKQAGAGKAAVYLDGTNRGVVDLYAATTGFQQLLFDSGPLTAGRHTLEIRVLGTKSAASTGTAVTVDMLRVD